MIVDARTFVQLFRDMQRAMPGRFANAHAFLIWALQDSRNSARAWWNAYTYAHALGML